MKKKIWAICLTLVLALAAFAISGCSLFNDVGTISWVTEPATEYTLNDQTALRFELHIELKDGKSMDVKYPEDKDKYNVAISGFSTTKVGTYTATVTCEKLSLAFSYKVTDGKFADGTGTASDPYMVSTAGQFQEMLNQKSYKYYKLANDIDFTGIAIKMANKGIAATDEEGWVGELDGNDHIVRGISEVHTSNDQDSNKYNEMFGRVGRANEKFVLKNITFDFASTGKSATMGLVTRNGVNATLEFNKVNVTGYLNAANTSNALVAPYVTFLNRSNVLVGSIKFINCVNSINIYNSYAVNTVAGFTGGMTYVGPKDSVVFDGCTFKGRIEGAAGGGIGAFYTHTSKCDDTVVVKNNCVANEGVIVKTGDFEYGNVISEGKSIVKLDTANVVVDDNLASITDITLTSDLKLSCSVANKNTITEYKVFVIGGMKYYNTKVDEYGGQFRYLIPCQATNGVLNAFALKKIAYSNADVPAGGDATYGSNLIRLNDTTGNLLYYGKSVCEDIKVDKVTKIVVVAYEGKTVVAFGVKAGSWNFAA